MFLLKYTSTNSTGYMLIYAETFEKAERKFREKYWFYDNLQIENCTYPFL